MINFASFYWVCVIYLLHIQYSIFSNGTIWEDILSYIALGFIIGCFSLWCLVKSSNKKVEYNLKLQKIFPIYRESMPIYLAIVVIALGIKDFTQVQNIYTIISIFIFIYILFHISNIGYLNPVWYILGYKVYKIENNEAIYVLITKNKGYKNIPEIEKLKKIDEFTFIESRE